MGTFNNISLISGLWAQGKRRARSKPSVTCQLGSNARLYCILPGTRSVLERSISAMGLTIAACQQCPQMPDTYTTISYSWDTSVPKHQNIVGNRTRKTKCCFPNNDLHLIDMECFHKKGGKTTQRQQGEGTAKYMCLTSNHSAGSV